MGSGFTKYGIPGLETVIGGASEVIAPGNPIGMGLMGSGIGQLAGGAAGGNSGQALGGSLGGLAGGLGGMMGGAGGGGLSSMFGGGASSGGGGGFLSSLFGPSDMSAAEMAGPVARDAGAGATASGGGFLSNLFGGGGQANPMSAASAGPTSIPGAGPPVSGGLTPAMFGGGGSGGGMSFQNIMQQYPNMDPLQAMQMSYLQKMMNPDPMQQMMSSMMPIGQQLLQGRQQQQLEAMSRQAPSANLNGGSMGVPASFGAGGAPVAAAPPGSMPAQYMQLLEMLTR